MKKFLWFLLFPLVAFSAPSNVPLSEHPTTHVISPAVPLKIEKTLSPKLTELGNLGASKQINMGNPVQIGTLTANCAITFTGWDTTKYSNKVELILLNNGGFDATWPGTVITTDIPINTVANSLTVLTIESIDAGTTVTISSDAGGGLSIVNKTANYTTTAADANGGVRHPSTDNNARTFTIDSNDSVKYRVGTTITFINEINVVTIAITTDTLTLQGANTTGSRTLAAGNTATALKVTNTKWIITGSSGLTWLMPDMWYILAA